MGSFLYMAGSANPTEATVYEKNADLTTLREMTDKIILEDMLLNRS